MIYFSLQDDFSGNAHSDLLSVITISTLLATKMFDCENREVEKVLVKMQRFTLAEGACFHPKMKIVESNGILKVTASPPRGKEMLMKIPASCMGAVQDFDLRVEGEHLAIYSHKKGLPKPQLDSFELMIEFYNLCDKVKFHKRTSPWFALSEYPELFNFIVGAKAGAAKIEELLQLRKEGDWERLLLKSFMGTRGFNLRASAGREGRQVLLPLLDYVNHHSAAPSFKSIGPQTTKNSISGKKRFIAINNFQTETGFNECFVSYCRLDPLDSLISYGFIDKSSQIFRSVAMEIDLLPGLSLQIDGRGGVNNKKNEPELPTALRKLQAFMPAVISAEPDRIRISHLLLPSAQVPFALRFILPVLAKNHSSGYSRKQILDASIRAEAEILHKNQQFYNQLHKKVISTQSATPNNSCLSLLKELADFQLERIKIIV